MHLLYRQLKQIMQNKVKLGHIEVPADGLETVNKREFISQESVHCSFIVNTLEHNFKKHFSPHNSFSVSVLLCCSAGHNPLYFMKASLPSGIFQEFFSGPFTLFLILQVRE